MFLQLVAMILDNWCRASRSSRRGDRRRGRSGSCTQQSVGGVGKGNAGTLGGGGPGTLGGGTVSCGKLLGMGTLGGGVVSVLPSGWSGGQNMARRCASAATVESPWARIGAARWGRLRVAMRSWIMVVSASAEDGKVIFTL